MDLRFVCALSVLSAPAAAADIPCSPVEPGVIHVDGLLEDWSEVAGLEVGGKNRDFSFAVKCNYDERNLYLAVDVHDDYLVRGKKARPNEDHLEVAFGEGAKLHRLVIFPGDGAFPRVAHWQHPPRAVARHRHPLKGIEIVDARQPEGWAVELRLALAAVPGWSPGAPLLRLAVSAFDSDSRARPTIETTLATAPAGSAKQLGSAEFAEGRVAFESFLADRGLTLRDIVFDKVGRVSPRGQGRALVAGRYLAILTDEYVYLELPVRSRSDLREVRLVDLGGDQRDAILVRSLERSSSGTREVLAAYRLSGEGLRRVFGIEVAKTLGGNRLATRVSYLRRGRATDLLVEAQPAVGWTAATYQEQRAADLVPIPLPWAAPKRVRVQFHGDDYSLGE